MKKLTFSFIVVLLAILCFSFSGCLAILGINEIDSADKRQAQKYLRSVGIRDTNIYQMDMGCVAEQIKKGINKDTSHNMFPLQNVLFEDGKLVSWIKVCDGPTQMKRWETFPAQSYSQLNPNYTIAHELECIKSFDGSRINTDKSFRYVYFVYFIRKNGIIISAPLRRFVKQSLKGISKHKKGEDVQIIYVNANPTDSILNAN